MYWWIIDLEILTIGVVLLAIREDYQFGKKENPIDVLGELFAKVEISKEEYEEQKLIINSKY